MIFSKNIHWIWNGLSGCENRLFSLTAIMTKRNCFPKGFEGKVFHVLHFRRRVYIPTHSASDGLKFTFNSGIQCIEFVSFECFCKSFCERSAKSVEISIYLWLQFSLLSPFIWRFEWKTTFKIFDIYSIESNILNNSKQYKHNFNDFQTSW